VEDEVFRLFFNKTFNQKARKEKSEEKEVKKAEGNSRGRPKVAPLSKNRLIL